MLIYPASFMISNSINYIICFIFVSPFLSNIHNAHFSSISNYNWQMFNNSHLINHQLFLESFVIPGRYLISFISYFLLLLVSHFKSPQIIVFLSSYIFFHSCKHTFDSDSIWIYYHLFLVFTHKNECESFYSSFHLWSSGYFVPDCNLPLSHYWNSDDLSLSLLCLCTYSV